MQNDKLSFEVPENPNVFLLTLRPYFQLTLCHFARSFIYDCKFTSLFDNSKNKHVTLNYVNFFSA